MDRKDWRTISVDDVDFDSAELARQLGPALPFTDAERAFLDLLLDRGEVDASILTSDATLQERIQAQRCSSGRPSTCGATRDCPERSSVCPRIPNTNRRRMAAVCGFPKICRRRGDRARRHLGPTRSDARRWGWTVTRAQAPGPMPLQTRSVGPTRRLRYRAEPHHPAAAGRAGPAPRRRTC